MDSHSWQMISQIFLWLGILLLICTVVIAARYKVVANLVSEIKAKKSPSEPLKEVHSAVMSGSGSVTETAVNAQNDDENITVVVGRKKAETVNDTIVVSRNNSPENDFRIIRNIIVINADPDVIDDRRSKK
ncbi:MAG: hypothetical protein K6G33_09085 [Ruminococcus sp.]|uniref:hypothetical protein n=1 Tax=Ruminococcus sp. TaxID=41978 RepID=UPI0025E0987D|nr:hypothetical protein [Ruminococcus sp.]MCR5600876.1 hypothetical protein [Ruminococcus sp.]